MDVKAEETAGAGEEELEVEVVDLVEAVLEAAIDVKEVEVRVRPRVEELEVDE